MGGKPRIRRTAEVARERILDVAEARLRERGPDALRLQSLAAEVGVSHPTILHHFGNRTGLVQAVVERTTERLRHEVISALTEVDIDELDSAALLERVFTALSEPGHARLLAWLFLVHGGDGTDFAHHPIHLSEIATAMHSIRTSRLGERTPPFEDTLFAVLLSSLVIVGNALGGRALRGSAGLGDDPTADRRFIDWLARMLRRQLESPADTGPAKA